MANRRMIAGNIFEDDFIGSLSWFERLLWIGIFGAVADDQGRFLDAPALVRSKVFLFDAKVHDDMIEQALCKLVTGHKVIRYEADGKRLVQITKWWIYQTPSWASPSKYPPPAGWVDRIKYHSTGNKIIKLHWDELGGLHSQLHSAIEEGDGDVKGEGEGDGDGEAEAPLPDRPNIFTFYEQNIGVLTPMIADELIATEKEYPADWIEKAIQEAIKNNVRNWKYCRAILDRWKKDGIGNGKRATIPEPVDRLSVARRVLGINVNE